MIKTLNDLAVAWAESGIDVVVFTQNGVALAGQVDFTDGAEFLVVTDARGHSCGVMLDYVSGFKVAQHGNKG